MRAKSVKCEKTAIKSGQKWKEEKPITVHYWVQKVVYIINLRWIRHPIIIKSSKIKFLVPP